MRSLVLVFFALALTSCQLLTNFVRPLVDDPDAPDADAAAELDAGPPLDAP